MIYTYFCDSTMAVSENLQNFSSSTFSSKSGNQLSDHLLLFLILLNFIVLVYLAYIVLGRENLPSPSNSQPQSSTHHSISPSPSNISTRNYTGIDSTPISRKFYRKFNSPSLKIKSSSIGKINKLEKLVKKTQDSIGYSQKQFQTQISKLIFKPPPPPSCSESEDEILKQESINLCNPYFRPSREGKTPNQHKP